MILKGQGSSSPIVRTFIMTVAINKQPDGTLELTITVPRADVEEARRGVIEELAKETNLPGFRKGKAPKKMVEGKLDPAKIREEVLKKILPQYYLEAVRKENLKPIINPKIKVVSLEEDKDWQFIAVTCEAPVVNLKDYKSQIQKITAKGKIVIPGKETQPPKLEEIVETLLKSIEVSIPQVIVDQEVDRLLSQTLDEIKALGLTLEQYLASTNKTAEDLRKQYALKAENDIKLEFALQKIAETERITVEEKEVAEAIQKAKDEAERKNLETNRYLLAAILRQQKTLDFLKNL